MSYSKYNLSSSPSNNDKKAWKNLEYNLDVYYGSFDDENFCYKLSEFIYSIISEIRLAIVCLISGLKSIGSLFILLLITIFFYAVLGNIYLIDNDPWHWSQLEYAIMSMIRIATLDDWNKIFYITYRGCLIDNDNDGYISTRLPYYVQDASLVDFNLKGSAMLCMDNYHSFSSISSSFNDDHEYIVGENVAENHSRPFVAVLFFVSFIIIVSVFIIPLIVIEIIKSLLDTISYPTAEELHHQEEKKARKLIKQEPKDRKTRRALNYLSLAMYGHRPELLNERSVTMLNFYYIYREEGWEIVKQAISQVNLHGWYLLICDTCDAIVENIFFKFFIDFCILYLSVIAGIMTSSKYEREHGSTFDIVQHVIIAIFLIEAIFKILAEKEGHFFYFHDAWNCLDFIVVILSYVPFLSPSLVASLRMLRLHQVLRKISILNNVITSAIYGIKNIFYIGILFIFYLLFMSIIGNNLFGLNDPGRFGTIDRGMITLLHLTTLDGLADAFYTNAFGCEAYNDKFEFECDEPIQQYWNASWFFTLNIIIGAYIIISFFVGIRKVFVLESAVKNRSGGDMYDGIDEILAKHQELTAISINIYRIIFELINVSKTSHLYKIELLIAIKFSGVNKDRHLRIWRTQNSDSEEFYDDQTMSFSRFISYLMFLRSEHLLRKQKKVEGKERKVGKNITTNTNFDHNNGVHSINQIDKNNGNHNNNHSEILLRRQLPPVVDEERRQVLLHQVDSEWKDFIQATVTNIDYNNSLSIEGVDSFDYMAETPTNLLRKAVENNSPYRFDEIAPNNGNSNSGGKKKKKKFPRKSQHNNNDSNNNDSNNNKTPDRLQEQFVPCDPDTGLEMSPMSPMSPIKIDYEIERVSPTTKDLQPQLSRAAFLGEDDEDDSGSDYDSDSDYEPSSNSGNSLSSDASGSASSYDSDDDSNDSDSLSDSDSFSSSEFTDAQSYAASWVETRHMRRQRKQSLSDERSIKSLQYMQKDEHTHEYGFKLQTYSSPDIEQKFDESQDQQQQWYSNANESISTMSKKKKKPDGTAQTPSPSSIIPTTINTNTNPKNTSMSEMKVKSAPRPPVGSDYEAAIVLLHPRMCKESIWNYVLKQFELCEINVCSYGFASATQLERTGVFDSHYKRVAQAALFDDPSTFVITNQKKLQFERTFSSSWDVAIATNKVVNAIDAEKLLGMTPRALGNAWRDSIRLGRGFQIAPDTWIAAVKRSNQRKIPQDNNENNRKDTIYVVNGHFRSMRESFLSPGARVLVLEITWRTSTNLTDRLIALASGTSDMTAAILERRGNDVQTRLTWKGLLSHVIGIGGNTSGEKNDGRPNHSICGAILHEWQSFGLDAPPTIVEDVVNSSHGAFEGMVHRSLWKQFTFTTASANSSDLLPSQPFRLVTDPLCVRLLSAGIAAHTIKHWMNNPMMNIPNEEKKPLFSLLKGLDSTATVRVCVELYQQSRDKIKATSSKIHP